MKPTKSTDSLFRTRRIPNSPAREIHLERLADDAHVRGVARREHRDVAKQIADAVTVAYARAAMVAFNQLVMGDWQSAGAIIRSAGIGSHPGDAAILKREFSPNERNIIRQLIKGKR